MEYIRPAFAATAIAIATAGLVVATPAAVEASGFVGSDIALTAFQDPGSAVTTPDLPDPFGVMQEVLSLAQRQMSDAFEYLGQGEIGVGVGMLAASMANMSTYAPLASFLTVLDAQAGQDPVWLRLTDTYFLGFSDYDGLVDKVQDYVNEAFDLASRGFQELAAGQINHGMADIFYSITNFVPDIPLQLMVGSAVLFEDMLGL